MKIHNKETATRMAACAALGLHYWSGHPQLGCVWAVDDHQAAHVVRVYAREGTACLQRQGTRPARERLWPFRLNRHAPWVYDAGERVPFTVSEDTQYLFVTDQPTNQEVFTYV